jgi:bacillopeptidase F
VITDLKPAVDQTLKKGESVKIEFTSEPGLTTTFAIHMPLTDKSKISNATELPMTETSPGYYVGYYTATKDTVADGAVIEVKALDSYGNESRKLADGKLFINVKKKGKDK